MRDTTPDGLHVTARAAEFLTTLEPGDVLLFQGADFLAGLAQLTERRTCYHSAIYVGTGERDGRTEHLLAHNVSTLWWRDLARQVPGQAGSLHPGDDVDVMKDVEARRAFFEVLAQNLVTHHLFDTFRLGADGLLTLARQLVEKGGVGVVSIEGYLDRRKAERLYGMDRSRTAVHHVRSVLSLRHASLDTEAKVDAAGIRLLRAAADTARDASGFNAAELLSVVPQCFDRPGYNEWIGLRWLADQERNRKNLARLLRRRLRRNQAIPSALDILRERLRTLEPSYLFPEVDTGPGWICASYVIATYQAAGLPLAVDHVKDVFLDTPERDRAVPLSTPRDLWDCTDLSPVAMFVRGPERWHEGPASLAPGFRADDALARTDRDDARPSPAVFVEHAIAPAETSTRITADLRVPVVRGPATDEEALQRAVEKLAWRWSVAPGSTGAEARWRAALRNLAPSGTIRISERVRSLRHSALVDEERPADGPPSSEPPADA